MLVDSMMITTITLSHEYRALFFTIHFQMCQKVWPTTHLFYGQGCSRNPWFITLCIISSTHKHFNIAWARSHYVSSNTFFAKFINLHDDDNCFPLIFFLTFFFFFFCVFLAAGTSGLISFNSDFLQEGGGRGLDGRFVWKHLNDQQQHGSFLLDYYYGDKDDKKAILIRLRWQFRICETANTWKRVEIHCRNSTWGPWIHCMNHLTDKAGQETSLFASLLATEVQLLHVQSHWKNVCWCVWIWFSFLSV